MELKLAIFDFDGTIADTRKPIVAAKQETMEQMGLEIKDEETCASTIGLSSKIGFQVLYPDMPEEILNLCVDTYRDIFEEKIKIMPPVLFDDVVNTLEWMKKKGITCTVASSRNRESLDGFLEQMQIKDYFTYVLGGEDTVKLKPNPEPVLKTLLDLSFQACETLVIGDMPMDIRMGKDAGAFTCGVTYGNSSREQLLEAGADYVIKGMAELKGILE